MDITYDLIIKYLVPKKSDVDLFITQKNMYTYSKDFPEGFKNLLTDKHYRYGIAVYDNEKNNISFWSSLLTLLIQEFIIMYSNDESQSINKFKNELIEKYSKLKMASFIKQFDKNDIRERIKLEPEVTVLQYVVDILDINFIIFDFETLNVTTVYHTQIMNPWKPVLLFAKFKSVWEPIMTSNRLFNFNDAIIKKILTSDNLVKYYGEEVITNKKYDIITDINEVVKNENKKLGGNIKDELTDKDDIKQLNKTKLNKMKMPELTDLYAKLELASNKKMVKADMINNILQKLAE